ncbi:proteasome subunit beta [Candidatus Woesearchaeota archaeon]|nr:proteasome subunit beta [Candidatus Woesearchaeota archaeon]
MTGENLKTGTTTIGIICKDAVVLAADKRATAGHLIANKDIEKVIEIMPNMALTTAGTVSDIQLLVKYLKAELKLKEVRTNRKPNVKEAANLLANFNYSNIRSYGGFGGVCHFLFGGYDVENGFQLYDIYPDGALTGVNSNSKAKGYLASGSGSTFAMGLLEDAWQSDLSVENGVSLAYRAINAALQRDSASGEGVDVFVIGKDGIKKHNKMISGSLN